MAPRRWPSFLIALVALSAAGAVHALDYLTVAEPAPMYDAPSAKSKPLFVALAGTPVELVVSLEGWSKVRDSRGDLAWIEKSYLAEKRNVIVATDRAQIRSAPEENASLLFEAERDVVLEVLEAAAGGWVKVRHRDGQSGYLKAPQVWGL